MEEKRESELEIVLKKTLERQSRRIAALMLDLDLAHSQIEILNEKLNELKPKTETE